MKRSTLIKNINQYINHNPAAKWDTVGWQSLHGPRNISTILVCLDVTPEVCEAAIQNKVDLIIHHHPFLFTGKKTSLQAPWKQQIWTKLKAANIGLYALHTNYDTADQGLNFQLLKTIKTINIRPYNNNPYLKSGTLSPPVLLAELLTELKLIFKTSHIAYYGDPNDQIKTIIMCCGAGGNLISQLQQQPGELFVTGEMKWQHWINAQARNVKTICVGHYMENWFVSYWVELLPSITTKIKIVPYNINNPIQYF